MSIPRRAFLLDLAAAAALAGCGGVGAMHGGSGEGSDAGPGGSDGGGTDAGRDTDIDAGDAGRGAFPVGIAAYGAFGDREKAIRRAVDLVGGVPWIKRGDTVLLKVAHNSGSSYPFTASPVACVAVARMCLEAGARRVVVADLMGIDATLVPGRSATLEDPFGSGFDARTDATLRAFYDSGLLPTIVSAFGASNVGKDRAVHVTSFREDGWSVFETESLTKDGRPRLRSDWVRGQLAKGETWTDGRPPMPFTPRAFRRREGRTRGALGPQPRDGRRSRDRSLPRLDARHEPLLALAEELDRHDAAGRSRVDASARII